MVSRRTTSACSMRRSDHPTSESAEPGVKKTFEALKRKVTPDLVLTHYRDDRHQDHRVLSDLAWNTFRDHLILEYEIPKYDGDLGSPNCFVPLDHDACTRKVALLNNAFGSQRSKNVGQCR